MSVIDTLTEGIRQRSLANEGEALLDKWNRTGLLEGLNDHNRSMMARLLENQAAQLLKETSTMAAGDVEGFASVAFPIVRRVFGGLIANDLVSVQPMSLPSGLIFFLDFTVFRLIVSGLHRGDEVVWIGCVRRAKNIMRTQKGIQSVNCEGLSLFWLSKALLPVLSSNNCKNVAHH